MINKVTITTIKSRSDFLRARKGRRAPRDSLIVESCPSPDNNSADHIRVGYTCTKKIGNAVRRNRTKRRLRAAARDVLSRTGKAGTDYVIIGRAGTADMPFDKLVHDLESAIRQIHKPRNKDANKPARQAKSQ